MAKTVFHSSDSRGEVNFGWLTSRHTFSFGHYYNPDRIHFGSLRVLNDDIVAAGMGFPEHPHANMEIISIPLAGALKHMDTIGSETIIRAGEIQVMSAGTGISHSEMNASRDEQVKFLQIWVFPNKKNVKPRYDQQVIPYATEKNKLIQILSPNPEDAGVWIHQDAWFHIGTFDEIGSHPYQMKREGNGVYFFVLAGEVKILNQVLQARDGFGVTEIADFTIEVTKPGTSLLVMDVPMR
jgi:redox-sensitive bicupin YhaK (pirin superfamily)